MSAEHESTKGGGASNPSKERSQAAVAQPTGKTEKAPQHGKRAVMVVTIICCLIIGGLFVDALTASSNAQTAKAEEIPPPSKLDPYQDFEARQKAEAARLEAERLQRERQERLRRERELAAQKASAQAAGETPVSASDPERDIRQKARLEELSRSLAAVRSGSMITSGSMPGASVKGRTSDGRAPEGRGAMADGRGTEDPRSEATLAKLRQAIERARNSPSQQPYARDLAGDQASSAVVGQSATARRVAGEQQAREGEYLLPVGSILAGVLDMEISSDWQGRWRGLLSRDVYDAKREVILLPKGTRILGTAARTRPINEAINQRLALAANWLVLPNGARIDLSRSGVLDVSGVGAIEGDVNRHWLATLGGVVAYGVIGGWGAAAASREVETDSDAGLFGRSAAAEIASGMVDIGKRIASRYLNLVPTITLKPGTPVNVFLDDEMYLRPWAPIDDVLPVGTQPAFDNR